MKIEMVVFSRCTHKATHAFDRILDTLKKSARSILPLGPIILILSCFTGTNVALAQEPGLPGAAANIEQIPVGSLIIPMDNIHQAIGSPFNLKSYGLANKLLQNYIPVKWAIRSNKIKLTGTVTTSNGPGTTLIDASANFSLVQPGDLVTNPSDGFSNGRVTAIVNNTTLTIAPVAGGLDWGNGDRYVIDGQDFTAQASRIRPLPAVNSATVNFAGGPFIVSNAVPGQVAAALSIASTFGQNVAVFQTTAPMAVDVRYTLTHKPFMSISDVNTRIHTDVMVAAGIPGSNTCIPPGKLGHDPNTCNWNQLSPANALQRECATIHLTPHRTENNGDIIANQNAIDAFVKTGANFAAQCHAVRAFENLSGVNVVGRFLTTKGITDSDISQVLKYPNSPLPFSQFTGPLDGNQGGSLQDFTLAGGAFKNNGHIHAQNTINTDRYQAASGKLLAGAYSGGNIFYLGGHNYNRNNLSSINGRRMLLNAIFVPANRPGFCGLNFDKPALSLIKDGSGPVFDYSAANDLLLYSYQVINIGNVALTGPVSINDDKSIDETCPPVNTVGNLNGNLDPGEQLICTASYQVTQADVNAASVTNLAIASAAGTQSNVASKTLFAVQGAALTLVKTGIGPGIDYGAVGELLQYTYIVTNTGNVSLAGPVIIDDDRVVNESCPSLSTVGNTDSALDPGEQVTCTASYTVSQADLNAGTVINHATASAAGTDSNEATVTLFADQHAALRLVKTGSGPDNDYNAVGDVLNYSYLVTNTGNVSLAGPVTVNDNLAVDESCPELNDGFLDPDEQIVCTASYTVTQADLNAGSVTNLAVASVASFDSNQDQETLIAQQEPSLRLVKTGSGPDNDYNAVGDVLTYSYEVTNIGNISLAAPVVISDDKSQNESCPLVNSIGNMDNYLDPGEQIYCSASYTITQMDMNVGTVTNRAVASAAGTASNEAMATLFAEQQNAALSLVKSGSGPDFDYSKVGDVLSYSFVVTNIGNISLAGPVMISDNQTSNEACPALDDGFLDPGEQIVCTASYTITQDDLNAGAVTNLATASAGGTVSNEAMYTLDAEQRISLALVKTGSGPDNDYDSVGDVLDYSYLLTNNGNISLTGPVVLNDDKAVDESCPLLSSVGNLDFNLDPGEEVTCTASYTVVQADMNLGSVTNQAIATVGGSDSNLAEMTLFAERLSAALSLIKTGSGPADDYDSVGDILNYSYLVTNIGNISLTGPVTISDDRSQNESCQPINSTGNLDDELDPGEQLTCTASYLVTQEDLNAGSVTNHATASAAGTDSNESEVTLYAQQQGALRIIKTGVGPDKDYSSVGDVLTYSYLVTNIGNISLAGPVTINDDKSVNESCPMLDDGFLDPSEDLTCTASYIVTQEDLNAGSVTNIATASAAGTQSNEDIKTLYAVQTASLDLVKSGSGPDNDYDAVGDVLDYSYLLTNNGNISLIGPVVLNDDKAVDESCPLLSSVGNMDINFDPGEQITCTASYTVVQADMNLGSVTNQAIASVGGSDSNLAEMTLFAERLSAALSLIKTGSGPADDYNSVGDILNYSYLVTNIGNISLAGPVIIDDDRVVNENCPPLTSVGNLDTNLDPAEQIMCTASYTVIQADLNTGSVTNVATASAAGTQSNVDVKTLTAVQTASLDLVKSGSGPADDYDSVGDVLNYSYLLTNNGNISLAAPFTIVDNRTNNAQCPLPGDGFLDPGEQIMCTASYTVVQADMNHGSVTNLATATGGGTVSNESQVTLFAEQLSAALSLIKTGSGPADDYDSVGDALNYSYLVTNIGNISLAGPVIVDDDRVVNEDCPLLTSVGNLDSLLDPDEQIICIASYVVTQADLNTGSVTNVATASAAGTQSNEDVKTLYAVQTASLDLVKSGSGPANDYDSVGDVLNYSYLLTNNGNISLAAPFTIVDDRTNNAQCPLPGDGFLDPGEQITCTASYTVVQADMNLGSVTNLATATADGTVSNESQVTLFAERQEAALSLIKTGSGPADDYDSVDDILNYGYLVTNIGNISLAGPVIIDDDRVVNQDCPPLTSVGNMDSLLDPGEQVFCIASYVITQADLNTGSVTNVATASAAGTQSNEDVKTLYAVQTASLDLVKSGSGPDDDYDSVGDVLNYSYLLTNNGNISLAAPFTIVDDLTNNAQCPLPDDGILDPGEQLICTASYTVVQADMNHGSVTNLATATAGGTVSNESQVTLFVERQEAALSLIKTGSGPTDDYDSVGDVLTYSYLVTNIGNISLAGPVTVNDDKSVNETCPMLGDGFLDPSEDLTCTASYIVTQEDLNAGSVTNVAFASASGTQSNEDIKTLYAVQSAGLYLVKTGNGPDNDYDAVGDVLNYSYLLTNNGNISLTGPVDLNDDKAVDESCPPLSSVGNMDINFDPGEQITCTASYTVVQADMNLGSVTNHAIATVSGSDSNLAEMTLFAERLSAALSLIKTGSGPADDYSSVGDVLNYSYLVTNIGNTSLTGPVIIDDDRVVNENCPPLTSVGNLDNLLDPAEQITCTASYTVTQADLNTGSVTNVATASGSGTQSNEDVITLYAVQTASLDLVKSGSGPANDYDSVGDVLNYSYLLTNNGNISLTGPVDLNDDKAADESCPPLSSVGNMDINFDPGEQITCTASYTVVQADMNLGSVTNHAIATVSGLDSNLAEMTLFAEQLSAALSLIKTGSGPADDYSSVGDVLNYSYLVTNIGNISLAGPVIVNDDSVENEDCPLLTSVGNFDNLLDPGEQIICIASYVVTQADLNTGSVTNAATASTAGTQSNEDVKTLYAVQSAGLYLVKTGSGPDNDYDSVGDVLNYSYLLTNNGNISLTGPVDLNDDKAADESCPPLSSVGNMDINFDPGEQITCTASYPVVQADMNLGSVTNHAIATVSGSNSNLAEMTLFAEQLSAALSLIKTGSGPADDYSSVGDVLNYSYLVTNIGNISLAGPVIIDDDRVVNEDCPPLTTVGNLDNVLDPAEQIICIASYVITQADLNTGSVTNHAIVSAAGTQSNEDVKTLYAMQTASLDLVKSGSGPANDYDSVGDVLNYSYVLTNNGNISLTGPVVLNDDKAVDESCPGLSSVGNMDINFDPGEQITCAASYTVVQADMNHGSVTNLATATAGGTVSNESQVTLFAERQEAALSLIKTGSGPADDYNSVGDILNYSYLVTNIGNISLAGPVAIDDDKVVNEDCPLLTTVGNLDTNLDPGEQITCTASYTVTQADLNTGSVTNVATVSAAGTQSNEDVKTLYAVQTASLGLVKSGSGPANDYDSVGDVLNYSYLLTNNGNISLTGPVVLNDDKAVNESCPPLSSVGNMDINFDPGEQITCTASYTVVQADMNHGSVTNLATATASSTVSNESQVTLFAERQEAALSLIKTGSGPADDYDSVDDILNYSYLVTNIGNISLAGPVTIDDDKVVNEDCPLLTSVGNLDSLLDPAEQITCIASYTVIQADMNQGSVTNLATATAGGTVSNESQVTLFVERQAAALNLIKTGSGPANDYNSVGDVLNYSYLVTNIGNISLAGPVTIDDDRVVNEDCPLLTSVGNLDTNLDPGEQITCSASYQVVQADLATGSVTNRAVAIADDIESNQDQVTLLFLFAAVLVPTLNFYGLIFLLALMLSVGVFGFRHGLNV